MIQILIVDDEKPICDLIQMSLTRAGYHCTCVYDGLARHGGDQPDAQGI